MVINQEVEKALKLISNFDVERNKLDEGDSHFVLAQHFFKLFQNVLRGIKGKQRLQKQIEVFNSLVETIEKCSGNKEFSNLKLPHGTDQLQRIHDPL